MVDYVSVRNGSKADTWLLPENPLSSRHSIVPAFACPESVGRGSFTFLKTTRTAIVTLAVTLSGTVIVTLDPARALGSGCREGDKVVEVEGPPFLMGQGDVSIPSC